MALGRRPGARPGILLLDEPFESLDAPLRAAIRADLADLHRAMGTTTILVTHDQEEALAPGGPRRGARPGRLAQVGDAPRRSTAARSTLRRRFIGSPPMSFLPATRQLAGLHARPGAELGLRAEDVRIVGPGADGGGAPPGSPDLLATVRRLEPGGHQTLAALDLDGHALAARLPADSPLRVGETVVIRLDLERASWFDAEGRRVD